MLLMKWQVYNMWEDAVYTQGLLRQVNAHKLNKVSILISMGAHSPVGAEYLKFWWQKKIVTRILYNLNILAAILFGNYYQCLIRGDHGMKFGASISLFLYKDENIDL